MIKLFRELFGRFSWQKLSLLVVLGLAVHLLIPQLASLEQSWQTLQKLAPWAVGLAIAAQVFSYLGSGYLLQIILHLTQIKIKLWRSTLIVLASASVGMVAGGLLGSSVAIYRWTSQGDEHSEGATLASILPSVFNNLTLMFVAMFGLVHLILVHDLSKTQLAGFITMALLLGSLIGIAALAFHNRGWTSTMVIRIARTLARWRRKRLDLQRVQDSTGNFFSAWDTLRGGAWKEAGLGAAINVLFDLLTLYFLFLAAGHVVMPGVLLAGYGLPLLLGKAAFVVPGGVGVVEGSMTALYSLLGLPDSVTVVVVLGYRLISFWLPSILGFPVAGYLQKPLNAPQQ